MRKFILFLLYLIIFSFSFSKIKIKIIEPLRFRDINHTEIGKNKVLAISHIEVYTDNKEKDLRKRVKLNFPAYINMTNRKKWIQIESIKTDRKNNEFILTKERELIKIYAILNKDEINKGEKIQFIEGEYIGELPIIVGIYKPKKISQGG